MSIGTIPIRRASGQEGAGTYSPCQHCYRAQASRKEKHSHPSSIQPMSKYMGFAVPNLVKPSNISLLTDDANKIYSFGRMDQKNRVAVILNQDSRSHPVTIPAYLVSMINGSSVTDELTGNFYQVQNGQVTVDVRGECGVVLVQ